MGVGSISLLPGGAAPVRTAAIGLRQAGAGLATARPAATAVEDIATGRCWQGQAFEAFAASFRRKPLPQAIDHATSAMEEAAGQLEWFASRFDANQGQLRWLQQRLASLATLEEEALAEAMGTVRSLHEQAAAVHEDHRWSLGVVAATFDRLDDEPTFATPPRSTLQQVGGALDSFATGIWEGSVELVTGVVSLLDPDTWVDLWNARDQIALVLQGIARDPIGFAGELGTALLDLDTLMEDPARWLGRRVPDLVLAVASGGLTRVGTTAAGAARTVRTGRAGGGLRHLIGGDFPAASRLPQVGGDVVHGLGSAKTLSGRMARLGADADAITSVGPRAALARSDTALGRLAGRVDQVPLLGSLRQAPGVLHGELRSVLDIPFDLVARNLATASPLRRLVEMPRLRSEVAGHLTGGFTSRLSRIDAVLVGAPVLSSPASTLVAGTVVLDEAAALADAVQTVETVAAVATAEPSR